MLSPTSLETKLIASYDAGSDGSLLPTLSPFSQTSRLAYASPSRDGGAFSRSLLSPPRSAGKPAYGGNSSSGGRGWPSSSPLRPTTLGGHAGGSDSPLAARLSLSHSPLSPLAPAGVGGLGMLHLRDKVWASPAKGSSSGGGGGRNKTPAGAKCDAQQEGSGGGRGGGGVPTPSKSPRSRDWKTAVGDSEQRFFAAAADARDAATAVTPGELREMAKQSGRADGDRRSSSSPGYPFESWGRERAGSWGGGGEPRNAGATSTDSDRQRQSSRGRRSPWSLDDDDNENEREGHSAAFTPSGGGEHQHQHQHQDHAPNYLETPRAPSHTTPSPAASRGATATDAEAEADADDTLLAAASLVSFQKPRAAEAPRLKGPLGTSALRVTLGTPVVTTGAPSISSSVQAKLSLPRTAPTPTPTPTPSFSSVPEELRDTGNNSGAQTPADPMETAYRAAGLAVGSTGGAGSGRSQGASGAGGATAAKSEASLLKSSRHGMFDAVSPTAPVQESGTPYSVCRVDRNGRPNGTPAAASVEQKKGHGHGGSGDAKVGSLKRGAASGESAEAAVSGAHGGGEPLCHTPLKRAAAGSDCGTAAGSATRPASWSGSGAGPWATPPPMAMGTPCSGSRFRSAGDEESDYSDYETVRVVGRAEAACLSRGMAAKWYRI